MGPHQIDGFLPVFTFKNGHTAMEEKKSLENYRFRHLFFVFQIDRQSVNNLFGENHKNEKTVKRLDQNDFTQMGHFFVHHDQKKTISTEMREN